MARFVAALRARGVSVLFPYLAWDTGTRREGVRDEEAVVALLRRAGAQGINGDSIPFVPRSFWDASVAAGYPIALQAEGGASDAALGWSTLGWGYWGRQSSPPDAPGYNWTYAAAPLVDRFKFNTRGAFLTTVCERCAKNKTDDLQLAYFTSYKLYYSVM